MRRATTWSVLLCVTVLTSASALGQAFTIAVLPDTQYYCRDNTSSVGGPLDFFAAQTRWVVDNAAARNIKFVTHLGDIVNTAGTTTASAQWNVAVNAMATLKNSTVPHSILPGNHDWTNSAGNGSLEHYRPRFGNTSGFFNGKSWFLGYDARGANSAQRFPTPAGDFLHIALEFEAGNPAQSSDFAPGTPTNPLAWAQSVIDANPGVPTIISTHDHLNTSARRDDDSARVMDALVRRNDQVFMVLNGHFSSSTVSERRVTSVNDFGRPVYEMLTDYQSRNRGGDGWMRLLEFDPANNRVTARTYTPVTTAVDGTLAGPEFGNVGRVETDDSSQFVLPLDFAQRFAKRPKWPSVAFTFERGASVVADTQLRQDLPTTNYGTATVLGVDGDEDNNTATPNVSRQTLVRFDNLFGTAPGQIPLDRDIVSARLVLDLNSAASTAADGAGLTAHRMLTPWSEATATWNTVGSPDDGVSLTGVSAPDAVARPDSVRGDNVGGSAVDFGVLEIDVTRSLRAYLNGAPNHGWALMPHLPDGGNGIFFGSSESAFAGALRPRLVVDATTFKVNAATFRQGLNGYAGTVDTTVSQAAPTQSFGDDVTIRIDAAVEDNAVASGSDVQALLRFDNLIGSTPSQIPSHAVVTSALLKLNVPADVTFSEGSAYEIYQLTRGFDETSTWNSLANGIEIGTDTKVHPDDFGGVNQLSVVAVGHGVVYLDVTDSVRNWLSGAPNFGWAIVPPSDATNAIFFDASERVSGGLRPELTVRWIPGPGALVPEPAAATVLVPVAALLSTRRRRPNGSAR